MFWYNPKISRVLISPRINLKTERYFYEIFLSIRAFETLVLRSLNKLGKRFYNAKILYRVQILNFRRVWRPIFIFHKYTQGSANPKKFQIQSQSQKFSNFIPIQIPKFSEFNPDPNPKIWTKSPTNPENSRDPNPKNILMKNW